MVKKILIPILFVIFAVGIFLVVSYLLNRTTGKGALQVTAEPKSKVYLNGKLIGETPLCKCEYPQLLDVGNYTVKLVPNQEGLNPFEQKITISPSVLTVVDRSFGKGALSEGSLIGLNKITDKNDAQILITSIPNYVQVFLDNNVVGSTPILLKSQTESDHEIKLSKQGYKDKIIRIRALKGYRLEAMVYLAIGSDEAALPSSSPSATPTPAITVTKVTILNTPTGFLRVRESNSLGAKEIGQVNPGDSFDLLDESTGWYQIKLTDGTEGWISSQYATKE